MKHELQILDECTPYLGEANDAFPMTVVIIYNDMHAALRAAQTLERLGRKFFGKMRQHLMPVPVNQLTDPARFDRLLSDASSADMIIVSFNGHGDFPTILKDWVKNCLTQKREGDSAVVALLSSNERLDAPESPRYQFIKNATRAAGLDFFAPKAAVSEEAYMMEQMEIVA
jgi:hypothetical protein